MGIETKINWLTDRQSQCDFDFDFLESERTGTRSCERQENWRENLSSEVLRELLKKN
jgi:hypothetical protein